ncbi:MAG: ATP-grasp domain-containing protein [Acidobacteria bacterium]|nr:ATP-grasp domain-containing protein [Acidobacteriota bacterium]
MESKRVLLLATTTGYQIRSFGNAAEKLGVRLIFASDRCELLEDPWWDQAIPVRFHEEARSVEAVVRACGGAAPDGIVAVGDRPVVLAAHLARAFGLPGHPPAAASASRNKLLTRRALHAAGLPTPWFESVPIDGDIDALARRIRYPAVVKPLALSGSRGVMRVDNAADCVSALNRLRTLLEAADVRVERDAAHHEALVEGFIPGVEYAVEGLLDRGTFRPLAIFDKPDPLDGPLFEETIYLTPSSASREIQQRIVAAVAAGAHAIGLHHGPVHAECRIDASTVYVLEIAARPIGGLCSRALRFQQFSVGADLKVGPYIGPRQVSLEELLLRHATGEDVSGCVREAEASGVMMIPIPRRGIFRRVEGLDEARAVPGVEDVRMTAKPDAPIVPLPEARSYLGFIFARGGEPAAVERALRAAHARLRFVIDREVELITPSPAAARSPAAAPRPHRKRNPPYGAQ